MTEFLLILCSILAAGVIGLIIAVVVLANENKRLSEAEDVAAKAYLDLKTTLSKAVQDAEDQHQDELSRLRAQNARIMQDLDITKENLIHLAEAGTHLDEATIRHSFSLII